MRSHPGRSRLLSGLKLFLVSLGALSPVASSANSCTEQYASLPTGQSAVVRTPVRVPKTVILGMDQFSRIPGEERRELLRRIAGRAERLRNDAHRETRKGEEAMLRYYEAIGAQVPKEGYVRALSVEEIDMILGDGAMGSLYDFNFRNEGARVGHGGNFIFLLCRKCPPDTFERGGLGSSVINRRRLELNELELVIPFSP